MKQLIGLLFLFVISIHPIQGQVDSYENANPTRYMVGGTAFNLKQGTFLYKNTDLLLNTLTYGVTDNFSMGLGMVLYSPLISSGGTRLPSVFIFAPKFGSQLSANLHLAAGCEIAYFPYRYGMDDSNLGFNSLMSGYALLTYGNANTNLTAGVYTLGTDFESIADVFIYNIGGICKIGKKFALVAESFILPGSVTVIDAGMRIFGKRTSLDFGLLTTLDSRIPLPIVDYAIRF